MQGQGRDFHTPERHTHAALMPGQGMKVVMEATCPDELTQSNRLMMQDVRCKWR